VTTPQPAPAAGDDCDFPGDIEQVIGHRFCSSRINLSSTTVVVDLMGRAAPTPATLWPRSRSSASFAIAYAPFGREESAMAMHSKHIPSASDAQLPPQSHVGRSCRVGRFASHLVRVASGVAIPSRQARLSHLHPAHSLLAPFRLLESRALRFAPPGVDSDSNAPRPDASVAKSTSARLPLHSARRARPTARTGDEFHHNLAGLEIAAGFERSQTAGRHRILPPLFWRHLGTTLFAYHAQKGEECNRNAIREQFSRAPDVVGQTGRHRWRARVPRSELPSASARMAVSKMTASAFRSQ